MKFSRLTLGIATVVPLALTVACTVNVKPADDVAGAGASSGTGGGETGGPSSGGSSDLGGAGGTDGGVVPEGRCRAQSDCGAGPFCVEPGKDLGVGVCLNVDVMCVGEGASCTKCEDDAGCISGERPSICEPAKGSCSGGNICTQGCASDDHCLKGESCNGQNRCVPKACETTNDCPSDFACGDGVCSRKTCTVDSECSAVCVVGKCFDDYGTCMFPPP